MDVNEDIYVKGIHLNCFQMHTILETNIPQSGYSVVRRKFILKLC
jgi:hypothetical protein